ncbi:XRE family transcriptional regulator [Nocardiopsis gilva YIM 90087]|uniref:XRE family transcriptional regulator n=1 Tax=Nocardiopsis gilva YIM 90087 TaxID=1235441 RepID=A0A223S1Q5_9ACTN|nr:helix-turn-helix transcriptional regulator [Nocardiopsis gilva]ASU82048.1 XRE family transcriptional regulator [Nocardiopsis gilva YIM 90087]
MTDRYSPTVRRRRLSAELSRVRKEKNLKYEEIASRTGIPRSTINNIEIGKKQKPTIAEITAILDACEVDKVHEREAILDLCRQSHVRGWWSRFRDVLPGQYVGFEAEAAAVTTWQPLLVPGLLQVPEYVETMARATLAKPSDVQRMIRARVERQQLLDAPCPLTLCAVFDEGALLRLRKYPEVLRAQVEQLIRRAELPHVKIQMTKADDLNPGLSGPFVIMDFESPVDPSIVYVETDTDGIYLEEQEDVARYRQISDHLQLAAFRPRETLDRLREMIE